MEELTLTTPALLFSAISLILLAYTNRFLSYAQLVRTLKDKHIANPNSVTEAQIINLRKRLNLVRNMQIFGIGGLLFCVASMFFIYIELNLTGAYVFGAGLVLLIISLSICIWEIIISVKALDIYLNDMEEIAHIDKD
ncbi:MAG: DUF2721 domain-containing protein [Bacteroidales bacterium]|jgi:hypothetical protein|nr:DUF2721 domain-containing protein [Bacteroidales bacterium]